MLENFNAIHEINNLSELQKNYTMTQLYEMSRVYPKETICMSIKDGTLCGPRLVMNNNIQEIKFTITNPLYRNIIDRQEIDIILIGRLMDNGLNMVYWPAATYKIYLNNQILTINHKFFGGLPVPVFIRLKKICVPGVNTITFVPLRPSTTNITFQVFVSHEPTVYQAFKATFNHAFITSNLNQMVIFECRQLNMEFTAVSRLCPLSMFPIQYPIRFRNCRHIQPIDLFCFLNFYAKWMINFCPYCKIAIDFNSNQDSVIIDDSLRQIFEKYIHTDMYYFKLNINGTFSSMASNNYEEFIRITRSYYESFQKLSTRPIQGMIQNNARMAPQPQHFGYMAPAQINTDIDDLDIKNDFLLPDASVGHNFPLENDEDIPLLFDNLI